MADLIYSIRDLFSTEEGFLKQEGKSFYNIPAYQRGYKWGHLEVKKLLDDINKFDAQDEKFYCLQNITLVSPDPEYFNIVDGQQRLTTLYLLLSYLGKYDLVAGKLKYPRNSIRTKTHEFLKDFVTFTEKNDMFEQNWDSFIGKYADFNHQDIFYLFSAVQTIDLWFKDKNQSEKNFDKATFLSKLLHDVKFVINNIKATKEEKVFGNLNSKRIPLDGADLVRAILVTRVANEEGAKESNIRNIVRVNERRVIIGRELDEINRWWSKPEVSSYFKEFTSISSNGDILFQTIKHPINLLLMLYAEKKDQESLSLEFIEDAKSALSLYKDIIKLHYTFRDWYQDREIYHYLGFLFFQKIIKFKDIWQFWIKKSNLRKNFIQSLKEKIKKIVFSDVAINTNPSINWYDDDPSLLVKILLILDIIHTIKNKNNSFLPCGAFSKTGNDIEHIFPQNPDEVKNKKEYIEFLNKYIVKDDARFNLSNFDAEYSTPEYQDKMQDFIQTQIADIEINSIGNLVLLDASLNRSITNNCYAVKRARVIEYFNNGNFIPPHTFNVFVRYFNTKDNKSLDLEHWTNKDIQNNHKAIIDILTNYFKDTQ